MARLGELVMGIVFLLTGTFVCAVAVLASVDGNGPPNPGLWVAVVGGGATLALLGLVFLRPATSGLMVSVLLAGMLLTVTGLGVAGLFFPESTADPRSTRGPETVEGAKVLGAVALTVPCGVVGWTTWRRLRVRRRRQA